MKYLKILAAALCLSMVSPAVMAQDDDAEAPAREFTAEDVMFGIIGRDDPTTTAQLLVKKIEQILGRCNAGAGGYRDVFAIEAAVTVEDVNKTEGGVHNVTTVSGELILSAVNRYTGAVYYSQAFPLSGINKGSGANPANLLIKSIKPTDAAYVRFIRNARNNIAKYVASHPEVLIIPEEPVEEEIDEATVEEDTPEEPQTKPKPKTKPATPKPTINCSDYGWKIEVTSCTYDEMTRTIVLQVTYTSSAQTNRKDVYSKIKSAMSGTGTQYNEFAIGSSYYHDFPYDIPVTVSYGIRQVYKNPGKIGYLEIQLGSGTVEIRNITVK